MCTGKNKTARQTLLLPWNITGLVILNLMLNKDTDLPMVIRQLNSPPQNGHLLTYRYNRGYCLLTKTKLLERVATAAWAAGLEPLQGHGICIGATLEYLLQGVPFDIMKAKGRWLAMPFSSISPNMPKFLPHICKQPREPMMPSHGTSSRVFDDKHHTLAYKYGKLHSLLQ